EPAGVGDYVLVGLANTGADTGGVAILQPDGTIVNPTHNQWGVKHIAVSNDNKTALISTDKGLLFFYYGSLTPLDNSNLAQLTTTAISDNVQVGFTDPLAK